MSSSSVLPMPPQLDLYEWSATVEDLFSDPASRTVDYSNFASVFDSVGLPHALAQRLIDKSFKPTSTVRDNFIKFVRLSTLRSQDRIPSFNELSGQHVDHRDIQGFTLRGRLNWGGGINLLSDERCIFVSHRWQSTEHPDPEGNQLRRLLGRLDQVLEQQPALRWLEIVTGLGDRSSELARRRRQEEKFRSKDPEFKPRGRPRRYRPPSDDEIFVWIDYACLPPRSPIIGQEAWPMSGRAGLADIPNIVKSCDLLMLSSPDYLRRLWCYTEISIWLCMLHERDMYKNGLDGLFRSILTASIVPPESIATSISNTGLFTNLCFRGFDGSMASLLAISDPVKTYARNMDNSGNYHVAGKSGGFDAEYLMHQVRFVCSFWYIMNRLESTVEDDVEVCLELVMEALQFSRAFTCAPDGTF